MAKLKLNHLIFLFILGLLLCSCSGLKKVPAGESLLIKNKISIDSKEKRFSKTNIESLIIQEPNTAIWGIRLKLGFFNMAKDTLFNKWNNRLREMGETPTIFDSNSIHLSTQKINLYLANNGYFSPEISTSVKRKSKHKRKVVVKYNLHLNTPYKIGNTSITISDDSIAKILYNWKNETLLVKGEKYSVDLLNKERERISNILQNQGYFVFTKDYISYIVDSALGDYQMNIKLSIRNVKSSQTDSLGNNIMLNHKKYYFDNIYITPERREFIPRVNKNKKIKKEVIEYIPIIDTIVYDDRTKKEKRKNIHPNIYYFIYDGKPFIKPKPVAQKVFLNEGDLFRIDNISRTYRSINDFKIFGYSNIIISEKAHDSTKSYDENNLLYCNIKLNQNPKFGFSTNLEFTTSSGIQGMAANVSFKDKNIFKGGEVLNLKLGGAYELQASFDENKNKSLLNLFEVKAEVSIDFPRFLAPITIERLSKHFNSKSTVSLGYNFQTRKNYSRGIFMAGWGYSWKKDNWSHVLNPVEISTIKMLRKADDFSLMLDTSNLRLKSQYEDHFILNARYSFIYNTQDIHSLRDFDYLRIGVETSGNLLSLISLATGIEKNPETNQYEMFGLAFSQYVKFDIDYKHHFVFGKDWALVFRGKIGIGISYGNSTVLPYEKSFYIGGSNSLRAWPIYQLGPGSYYDLNKPQLERLGDIALIFNLEQRLPIYGGLQAALFIDAGNIWYLRENSEFPDGNFDFERFYKEIAVGIGFGLRYDFGFFLIRLDLGIPVRNPALPEKERWMLDKVQWKDLLLNFGIGYPF